MFRCTTGLLMSLVVLNFTVTTRQDIVRDKVGDDSRMEPCYRAEVVLDGLRNPLALAFLDNDFKMLVAEQTGVIRFLDTVAAGEDGGRRTLVNQFMSIEDRVVTSDAMADERGLLGLTLDPEFKTNNLFYVFYSGKTNNEINDHDSIVSRFQAVISGNEESLIGDKSTELILLRIPQPHARQNGGQVFFGGDGLLYITTGDGGDRKFRRFQKDSLLGKILRIDVRGSSIRNPYRIPPDNPFVNDSAARGEVYAYGFRNPWRCTVDRNGADLGRIFCGDIGEPPRNEEDVNLIERGGRYGWFDDPQAPCNSIASCRQNIHRLAPDDKLPIHTYSHDDGQAIVTGPLYRGNQFPGLTNHYIYADYVHGTFHLLEESASRSWITKDLCVDYPPTNNIIRKYHVLGVVASEQGNIYVLANSAMSNSYSTGIIFKLTSCSGFRSQNSWFVMYLALVIINTCN